MGVPESASWKGETVHPKSFGVRKISMTSITIIKAARMEKEFGNEKI
jgi:hypothetical protein